MTFIYFLLFVFLTPMVAVAVGLVFKVPMGKRHFSNGRTIDNYRLPKWLKWFANLEDWLTGDDRGWFWFQFKPSIVPLWLWQYDNFKMWWWSAIRNPWNYVKRFVVGCDIRLFDFYYIGAYAVKDNPGEGGFQLVIAWPKEHAVPRIGLYWVHELSVDRCICVQLGWKIQPKHAKAVESDWWDYFKGVTFEVNPYKKMS